MDWLSWSLSWDECESRRGLQRGTPSLSIAQEWLWSAPQHGGRWLTYARGPSLTRRFTDCKMPQTLGQVSILVRDYEEARRFYVEALGFELIEDIPLEGCKRWVVVAPDGGGVQLLLARATNEEQAARVGNQTGGRVFLFLQTDDCLRDFEAYRSRGVRFVQPPERKPHGTVAVFEDLYGNLWDLIERQAAA